MKTEAALFDLFASAVTMRVPLTRSVVAPVLLYVTHALLITCSMTSERNWVLGLQRVLKVSLPK